MSFVARYTPVYVVADVFNICTIEELAEKYGGGLWTSSNEVCELTGVYSWSDKGWTRLLRVIRHELAPNTMTRIMTHHGLVDMERTVDVSRMSSTDEKVVKASVDPEWGRYPTSLGTTAFVSRRRPTWNPYRQGRILIGTEMLHHRIPTEPYAEYIKNNNNEKYNISGITDHLLLANYCAEKQSQELNIRLATVSSFEVAKSNRFRRASSGNIKIKLSKEPYTNSDCEIQEIKQLSADEGYVYSLTTENHHFAAGIGNMILNGFD